jgi:hypothetical protein
MPKYSANKYLVQLHEIIRWLDSRDGSQTVESAFGGASIGACLKPVSRLGDCLAPGHDSWAQNSVGCSAKIGLSDPAVCNDGRVLETLKLPTWQDYLCKPLTSDAIDLKCSMCFATFFSFFQFLFWIVFRSLRSSGFRPHLSQFGVKDRCFQSSARLDPANPP